MNERDIAEAARRAEREKWLTPQQMEIKKRIEDLTEMSENWQKQAEQIAVLEKRTMELEQLNYLKDEKIHELEQQLKQSNGIVCPKENTRGR
ncbi:MAG: hypothetical protein QM689_01560 [Oscillospiraceae bacterium]